MISFPGKFDGDSYSPEFKDWYYGTFIDLLIVGNIITVILYILTFLVTIYAVCKIVITSKRLQ
jgi:hypothetical protein